jgi:DeoR family transcriptional regulator of aga operon
MKQQMIKAAKQVIVLADSSKFGPTSFCEICRISEVHEVITDSGVSPDHIEAIRAAGTLCCVVDMNRGQAV